jgi:DNA-binding transcriptional LysR family regulator
MQDLNELLFFAEVVDHGGFAAAARALNLPKSRLSRRVAELEAGLGVRLLHRTTRKLWPILPVFLARYPQVRIDMRVSNRVVDLVEEGVDVALRVRPSLDDSGSLVVKNLGATYALLVASPAQLRRQGNPTSLAELARLDSVAMSAVDGRAVWQFIGPDQQAHTVTHQPRLVADDLLTLKMAILGGTGVGLVPDYMCRDELVSGRLVAILAGWAPAPAILHAVYPSRRGLAPATRRFLDFMGEYVTGQGVRPDARFDDPGLLI